MVARVRGRLAAAASRPRHLKHETPTLDVTSWTDKTELFMEYPPLVAGQTARFAVHLTQLADFKRAERGQALDRVHAGSRRRRDGASRVREPSRPGAFRVEGAPPAAGRYRWALMVEAPGLTDRHDLGW